MAKADTYKQRIDSCKSKLEKLQKKLERILKAEESNYEENNPYYYSDYDKRCTLREIEEINVKLVEYESKYNIQIEKENSRNVQVIIDFLQGWKVKVMNQYMTDMEDALIMTKELTEYYTKMHDYKLSQEERKQYEENYNKTNRVYHSHINGWYMWQDYTDPYTGKVRQMKVKVEEGKWEHLKPYFIPSDIEGSLKRLEKDLDNEMNRKYDFIIERTNKIVGEITDITNIRIADNGELNGIIIGTRGRAKVTTIIANGPIRIAHFRVLVKEVK